MTVIWVWLIPAAQTQNNRQPASPQNQKTAPRSPDRGAEKRRHAPTYTAGRTSRTIGCLVDKRQRVIPASTSGCSITCNSRAAAWLGWRVPCSQLCTVFDDTFSNRENPACERLSVCLRSRMRCAENSGGGGGTRSVDVRKARFPRTWSRPSVSPVTKVSKNSVGIFSPYPFASF